MFKKILYPTDFSDVADRALEFIKSLKEAGAEEVVMLHVIDQRALDVTVAHAGARTDLMDLEQTLIKSTEDELAPRAKQLTDLGFRVKTLIRKEIPFREILQVEQEENPAVIVIGSHGKSNIGEMLLGSASEKVIRKAKSPVLVIKR